MKIEWAPGNIPPRRRLQTFAAGFYVTIVFSLTFIIYIGFILLFFFGNIFTITGSLFYLAYTYWEHKINFSACNGIGIKWMRSNFLWKQLRNYFPVELVKTTDLTPNRNYILACFPHGIIGTSFMVNLALDIDHWLKLFPGVRPKLATLDVNLRTPVLREILRFSGLISVEKESLRRHLCASNDPKDDANNDGFTANAVAITIGGAQEAFYSHPRNYTIVLNSRKGFVRLALETGTPIVPVFSFGEVDIFDQIDNPPESWLGKFQAAFKKASGIAPIFVIGRGFFQYSYGFIPHRARIVQVVGVPIEITKCENPSKDQIDKVHADFVTALIKLFEENKHKYIKNADELKLSIC